jgi:dihydropteroate synthase
MSPDETASTASSAHPLTDLLAQRRPLVMGILNVTPDSFSDGGSFMDAHVALAHAREMIAAGADILDVGGESTRPYGALPVGAEEEWRRIGALVPLLAQLGVPLSVDTMKASVADSALKAGATIINDVWGLQRDPDMAPVIASSGATVILMHNRAAIDPHLDWFADIAAFLSRSVEIAERAGIPRDRIVLDPGIGFGKTPEQSIAVIANLDRLRDFGLPLLIGLSRKRFIASVSPSETHERLGGSIAANLHAAKAGASILRVHDVAETVQALRIMAALERAADR